MASFRPDASDDAAQDAVARLQQEIGEERQRFASILRSARDHIRAAGMNVDGFLATTGLFDGPAPEPLQSGAIARNATVYGSPIDTLRGSRFAPGGTMCVIGPGIREMGRAILAHCVPKTLHLLAAPGDHIASDVRDQSPVVVQEGEPAELVRHLADETLDFAFVDGDVSYTGAARLLENLLPKVRSGGVVQVKNYTPWSWLSGLPYGVSAVVNGLVNRGVLRVVGFVPHAHGYHQIVLEKVETVAASHGPPSVDVRYSPLDPRPSGEAVDGASVALHAAAASADFDDFVRAFLKLEGRRPAILDWGTGHKLATTRPELPVFSSPGEDGDRLPYIDASIDVVAIPAGDAVRMREARRIATAAVVEIESGDGTGAVKVTVHRLPQASRPAAIPAADAGLPRHQPLEDCRILVCSHYLPQPDCDSYSRRLFHFVGFLLDAGCEVTCVAANPAGHDAFGKLLTDRGVRTLVGLAPEQMADVAREGRFDWAVFGFWNTAAPLMALMRARAPEMRLVIDSGDIHFLRAARQSLCDADGMPGRLGQSFGGAATHEIDVYAAADGVLAVSRKEADLIADLVGDTRRSFVIPDTEELSPSPFSFSERRGMFFVGNFKHAANAEALEHLCRSIVPHLDPALLAEHPLFIVGSNMSASQRALAAGLPGVRILGWVPSVVPYLERVRVSLIPLLHGAGTKRKMIQALSVGTPTVSTTVGIEGFPLQDEREVIIADDPIAFASGITRLLTDGDLWHRLASAGRETIRAGHSHAVGRERLLVALEAIRGNPRRRPPSRVAAALGATNRDAAVDVTCRFEGLAPDHVVTRLSAGPPPRISVVVPTRDRATLLRAALASLAAQSAPPEAFEVVVVSDGSTDGTADVCREFAERLRLTRVDGPPSGIGRAKNIGMEVATAPLVLFFDDDHVADRGLVAAHLAAHARYPLEHVAVLGCTAWHPRLGKTELMRFFTDVGHPLFGDPFLQDGQVLDHTRFWGGRASCKRSLIIRAHGFRSDLAFGSEDIEAGYRISRMLASERRAAGLPAPGAGLTFVFRRDAIQHVNRPKAFDEICAWCERQGRAQRLFSRLHDDPAIDAWVQVDEAEALWRAAQPVLADRVARVHDLERLLADAHATARRPLRDELHELYRWTFDAFKAKGMVVSPHDRT